MNFRQENGFFAGLRFPQLAGSEFSMCQLKNVRETVNICTAAQYTTKVRYGRSVFGTGT